MIINEMLLFSVAITEKVNKRISTWSVSVVANNSRHARKKAVIALEMQGLITRKYISDSNVFIMSAAVFV